MIVRSAPVALALTLLASASIGCPAFYRTYLGWADLLPEFGATGERGFVIDMAALNDHLGSDVAGIGDVNGDGIDDVAVGLVAADPNGTGSGAAVIVFGRADVGASGRVDVRTLAGPTGFVVHGEGERDLAGYTVAGIGDVNNDGFNDVLIGAPDAGPVSHKTGRCYVLFGGPGIGAGGTVELGDLDGTTGFIITGSKAGDRLGTGAAGPGDLNGDGIDDLIIQASGAEPLGTNSGECYLIYGQDGLGSGGLVDLAAIPPQAMLRMQSATRISHVAAAGDPNHDGLTDLIVGQSNADDNGDSSGRAMIVYGGAQFVGGGTLNLDTLTPAKGLVIVGPPGGERVGGSVAAVGDINGDGVDDVVLSAASALTPEGRYGGAYVVLGNSFLFPVGRIDLTSIRLPIAYKIIGFAAAGSAGRRVCGPGDLNADGYADLVIASDRADFDDDAGTGETFVLFGGPDLGAEGPVELAKLNGRNGFSYRGVVAGDESGGSISAAGDVNADGLPDLIVGAPEAGVPGLVTGQAYVLFGAAPEPVEDAIDAWSLRADYGADGSAGAALFGTLPEEHAGEVIAAAGDVNGDGYDDLLVGAPGAAAAGNASGRVFLVFGGPDPITATADLDALPAGRAVLMNGVQAGNRAGWALAGLGDVNADGFDDVLIGARLSTLNPTGVHFVVFGGPAIDDAPTLDLTTLDGSNGFAIYAEAGADGAWNSVAVSAAGDLNADGIPDIAVSSPEQDAGGVERAGRVYVIFGRAGLGADGVVRLDDLDGFNGFRMDGLDTLERCGSALAGGDDLNGDGIDDLLIGAPSSTLLAQPAAGRVYAVFGGPGIGATGQIDLSGLDGHNGFVLIGPEPHDGFGEAVAMAGDLNADGVGDLAVGAPRSTQDAGTRAGNALVVFGGPGVGGGGVVSAPFLQADQRLDFVGSGPNHGIGLGLAGLGDINGDRIDDLLVGSAGGDGPPRRPDSSRAFVLYGSTAFGAHGRLGDNELDGNNGFAVNGAEPADAFAHAVSRAGDFNADGVADFAIGARRSALNGTGTGAAYLFLGCDRSHACSPADLDASGEVNADDLALFIAAFLDGILLADLDGNERLNLDDIQLFVEAYTAGCR